MYTTVKSFISLLALSTSATSLALPQVTTGSPGAASQPFASNTTMSFFTGKSFPPGTDVGSVSSHTYAALDGCGIRVGHTIIKSMYCTPLKHSAISIGQVANGSCTFTLFAGSNSCDVLGLGSTGEGKYGYNRHEVVIPNGSEETCIGTGVMDGGKFSAASGIWACG